MRAAAVSRTRARMRLTLNGEQRDVDAPSVAALLVALALPADQCAVEVNGALVKRAARAATPLHDGDVVEIVTLVGGG